MIELTAKKTYGDRVVLDVEKLSFEEGRRYALIGANGSGKSTLLSILAAQTKPDEGGAIVLDGARVAYMPQSSFAFDMSVRNNVLLSSDFGTRKERGFCADMLIKSLGLWSLRKKNAAKLSGGETQRMALARTLMVKCDLLLLDEPTAALDVEQAKSAVELLKRETEYRKNTLIFATHSLRQAELLADEVLFLKDGKVLERGTPQMLLENASTEELRAFLAFNA